MHQDLKAELPLLRHMLLWQGSWQSITKIRYIFEFHKPRFPTACTILELKEMRSSGWRSRSRARAEQTCLWIGLSLHVLHDTRACRCMLTTNITTRSSGIIRHQCSCQLAFDSPRMLMFQLEAQNRYFKMLSSNIKYCCIPKSVAPCIEGRNLQA